MQLIHGDCLEEMKNIPDKSVDMVLTDTPYGTTACKWDTVIPFEPMWEQLHRVTKDNGAICLFGSEPFSSALRMSNIKRFKYDWVWNKKLAGNALNAKKHPLKICELVSVFYTKPVYYPQMRKGKPRAKMGFKNQMAHTGKVGKAHGKFNDSYYPTNLIEFSIASMRKGRLHPTQKPVPLLEYLIKTYTLENETVLDFTMGSGSTGVACKNLNREFLGIEKEKKYFDIAVERITKNQRCEASD